MTLVKAEPSFLQVNILAYPNIAVEPSFYLMFEAVFVQLEHAVAVLK